MNIDTCVDIENSYYCRWAINRLNEHRFFASGDIHTSEFPYNERGLISEFDENGNFAYCTMDTSIVYFEGILTVMVDHLLYHGVSNEGIEIGEFLTPDQFIPRMEIDSISAWDYTFLISGENICIFSQVGSFPDERAVLVKIPRDAVVSNINEANNSPVKVYPNPSKDYVIFVDQEGSYKNQVLTVTNAYGQKITSFIIENETTYWDIRQIKAGIYFYSFEKDNSRFGGKIIVMR